MHLRKMWLNKTPIKTNFVLAYINKEKFDTVNMFNFHIHIAIFHNFLFRFFMFFVFYGAEFLVLHVVY